VAPAVSRRGRVLLEVSAVSRGVGGRRCVRSRVRLDYFWLYLKHLAVGVDLWARGGWYEVGMRRGNTIYLKKSTWQDQPGEV